jgi:membrane protein required for colicin V production
MQASFSSRGGSAGLVAAALKAPASLSPFHAKGNADLPNCNGPIRMNPFDAAVYLCLLAAIVLGFNAGLLRSLATIVGYLAAAPVAVGVAPYVAPLLAAQLHLSPAAYWAALTGVFLAAGIVLGALLRLGVCEVVGERISVPDRLAGALLGAVRIGLVAVLIVLIFDRVIPTGREPAFLAGSRLRPLLSQAGEAGVNSLPPEAVEAIDRLKHARGF